MNNLITYKPAHFVNGKNLKYIAYSVLDEQTGKFKTFRIKLNRMKVAKERRNYADNMINKINDALARGWTPFQEVRNDKLTLLSEALKGYFMKTRRDVEEERIKNDTYNDYFSQLNTFAKWLKRDFYLHNITSLIVSDFLDYIYIVLKRTSTTRNNYFCTLRTFFNYCIEKGFINKAPTEGMHALKKQRKKRAVIPHDVMIKISKYLERSGNEGYKLAVNLCYSCFIRPIEIAKLKIKDINFKNSTITIPAEVAKNGKEQTVTMPENVQSIMYDAKIWENPSEDYIISRDGFRPGPDKIDPKRFRDRWAQMRNELKIGDEYQFYSLKDSGITNLLKKGFSTIEVRDQARHSSIAITDIYTDKSNIKGNESIRNLNFGLTD